MEEKPSIIDFHIKKFRAIKEAKIKLDGITVIAGENSSGKSTISNLLYYIFKIANTYNDIIKEEADGKLDIIIHYLRNLRGSISGKIEDKIHYLYRLYRRSLNEKQEKLIEMIQAVKQGYLDNEIKIENRYLYRLQRLIVDDFKSYIKDLNVDNDSIALEKILNLLENIVMKIFNNIQKEIKARDKRLFEKKLRNIYNQRLEHFSVSEYGVPIISKEDKELGYFQTINTAIYIDSPMAVENPAYHPGNYGRKSLEIYTFSHWNDLDYYLKTKNKKQIEEIRDTDIYNELQKLFSSQEILNGNVRLDESKDQLMFDRNDGNSFKMIDCATGIKSIATLQMLYQNGWLTHKTLLILDEPEAHLHPQWVVEYARLMVLLNKKIGVKFFISSHHPDMISAIHDICDKEKLNDNLKFYLAEIGEDYSYTFEYKGIKIGKIFDSFNIAINRINEYGGDNE